MLVVVLIVLLLVSAGYNGYQNLIIQALREQLDEAENKIKLLKKGNMNG